MRKKILQSEVDAILTNETIMSRLQHEKNLLKRLIQENRLLADRISVIDREYCALTGSEIHKATYSKGILTHQYLKGKRVFRVKVGALKPRGGFSKAYVVDIPLEILNNMKKEEFYRTDYRCFTTEEAKKQFRELVSVLNWELLSSHITDPFLATFIEGFTEQNGTLFFLIDGEMTSVTYNLSHPRFSN